MLLDKLHNSQLMILKGVSEDYMGRVSYLSVSRCRVDELL